MLLWSPFHSLPNRPAGLGIAVSIKFRSFTPDPTLRFQKFLRPSEKLISMVIDKPGKASFSSLLLFFFNLFFILKINYSRATMRCLSIKKVGDHSFWKLQTHQPNPLFLEADGPTKAALNIPKLSYHKHHMG